MRVLHLGLCLNGRAFACHTAARLRHQVRAARTGAHGVLNTAERLNGIA